MSARKRSCCSADWVAFATLAAFFEPSDLLNTSFTPANSRTARTVFKLVQRFNAHRDIAGRKTRIVEAALGNPANQRHLAAFKADADRAAGAGGLAFAAPAAGLAVAAGFTLAQPLATVFGPGTGFEIV